MADKRASFTTDVIRVLFEILPNYVNPSGGKTDWEIVATTLNTRTGKDIESLSIKNWFTHNKNKHKAWNELKQWTGIGWTARGCPDVDVSSEKWKAFVKRYRSYAKGFLKNPFENEAEWDKILQSGYATGDRSYTPASLKKKEKEVETIEEEESGDSDELNVIEPHVFEIDHKKRKSIESIPQPSRKSSKSSREEDIDTCLLQMKKSSVSHSSKPLNVFEEVQIKLDAMGITEKYGDEFVVDILESFRRTPNAIELFNSLRTDTARRHFLRKHCVLEDDDVYRPMMHMDEDTNFMG